MTIKRVPIAAAKRLAKQYGYEQVIIIARKVSRDSHGGSMATYGTTRKHCDEAADVGNSMVERILHWEK